MNEKNKPVRLITSKESRKKLLDGGYTWEGRMVFQHRCDWEYWPNKYLNNPNVKDFVLAYNGKHSGPGFFGLTRLDMFVKWRAAA
ncbi:MAG: hypothetical protein AABW91_03330 [Nanoarchaeota archaeon]